MVGAVRCVDRIQLIMKNNQERSVEVSSCVDFGANPIRDEKLATAVSFRNQTRFLDRLRRVKLVFFLHEQTICVTAKGVTAKDVTAKGVTAKGVAANRVTAKAVTTIRNRAEIRSCSCC